MTLAIAFALLGALGFGTSAVLIRLGTQRVPATAVAFLSVTVGAVLASALALSLDFEEFGELSATDFGWFALFAFIGYPVARLLTYVAITLVGVARASPIGSMRPVFAVGLAMAILGERPGLLVGLGTPVIVIGVILVVTGGNLRWLKEKRQVSSNLGYLLALAAAFSFGSREVISRHVVSGIAPPLITSAFGFIFGAIMLIPLSRHQVARTLQGVPLKYILLCLVAGVCEASASISLLQALSRAPVVVVTPISASTPLIVLVLSHLFLQRLEAINIFLVLGTFFSVGGVVMVIAGAR